MMHGERAHVEPVRRVPLFHELSKIERRGELLECHRKDDRRHLIAHHTTDARRQRARGPARGSRCPRRAAPAIRSGCALLLTVCYRRTGAWSAQDSESTHGYPKTADEKTSERSGSNKKPSAIGHQQLMADGRWLIAAVVI